MNCPAIKVMMMPKDTNPHGIIFGGVILSYIDQAGAVYAEQACPPDPDPDRRGFVTVAIDSVEFKQPVFVGDVLALYAETVRTGRTSITVKVTVEATRSGESRTEIVTTATLTYVAVDEDRHAVPLFIAG